ncbi:RNA polymerase sigma factor [Olivibacter sitiensis]|uniref:RNA polymerase sigma factor n=1 Tax=Olivibacter sitiensis TaxID=376470 RepID=UPI000409F104|nr:sigma-70 family RNA polymerase sigma factor [Olivibacter sitiensis]
MNWFKHSKKSDELDDDALLERYRQTDDLSFLGELFARHAEMVYYVCFRYLQDGERSKDATMQIFEELIVKVHKQEIKRFATWLYVLSRNHCLMQLRSEKKMPMVGMDEFVEFPLQEHPNDPLEKERSLSALERCMEKLSKEQRDSVDLFFLNGKCYKEIVEMTGYSMKEVKSYIQNGKRNLKICMEKHRED